MFCNETPRSKRFVVRSTGRILMLGGHGKSPDLGTKRFVPQAEQANAIALRLLSLEVTKYSFKISFQPQISPLGVNRRHASLPLFPMVRKKRLDSFRFTHPHKKSCVLHDLGRQT